MWDATTFCAWNLVSHINDTGNSLSNTVPPPIKLSADETNLFIFSNTGEDLQAGVNGKYCSLIIGSLLTLRTDIGADKDSR